MWICMFNSFAFRRDKYNRKLWKYYVEYEEGDESVDEDIEKETHEEIEARYVGSISLE